MARYLSLQMVYEISHELFGILKRNDDRLSKPPVIRPGSARHVPSLGSHASARVWAAVIRTVLRSSGTRAPDTSPPILAGRCSHGTSSGLEGACRRCGRGCPLDNPDRYRARDGRSNRKAGLFQLQRSWSNLLDFHQKAARSEVTQGDCRPSPLTEANRRDHLKPGAVPLQYLDNLEPSSVAGAPF